MTRVGSYRELRVYRQAFDRAMALREIARSFPDDERYDLARQIRRSSRSVCANVAEAWRRRMYPASFVAKLIDAEAEASETRVHLEFAEACGYMTREAVADFDRGYDAILAQLTVMRSHPERWRPLPQRNRTRAARTPRATPHPLSRRAGSKRTSGEASPRDERPSGLADEAGVDHREGRTVREPPSPAGTRPPPGSGESRREPDPAASPDPPVRRPPGPRPGPRR